MRVLPIFWLVAMLTLVTTAALFGDASSIRADGPAEFRLPPTSRHCLTEGAALLTGQLASGWQRCASPQPGAAAGAATGSIGGTIRDEGSGSPIQGACALAVGSQPSARPVAGISRSDANGGYRIGDLPAAAYKLWFLDCGATGTHIEEWYDNADDFDPASDVTVGDGQDVTGVDAALADGGGSISGTVTENGSGGLDQVCVYVADDNDQLVGGAVTDNSGSYTVGGLPSGEYRLEFEDCFLPVDHAFEWYNNRSDMRDATMVTVVDGTKTGGIDVGLDRGASITGTVTEEGSHNALSGICVEARDESSFRGVGITDASGNYSVGGLPPGRYHVLFSECAPPLFHVDEYYNNEQSSDAADAIQVGGAGSTRTSINAALAVGGSISGRVDDGVTHEGLAGICVFAFGALGFGITDAAGDYELGGLPPGDYGLVFFDCQKNPSYAAQISSPADAIHVSRRAKAGNHNASLARGAVISGTVTEEGSGRKLSTVCLFAFDSRSYETRGLSETTSLGKFAVVVRSGNYKITFFDCADRPTHNQEWYNNKLSFDTANVVHAGAVGHKTGGIDAALAVGRAGDVTCEGDVTSVDAALLLQYVAGLLSGLFCDSNADVNGDGQWNAVDATLILQYVAGLLPTLPA